MCGFVGCVSPEDRSRQVLDSLHLLRHRGPDDSGFYVASGSRLQVALAHQRLSIIDLNERSRQPLGNEDGTVLVCYSGEIYNFRALRHELQNCGHEFRTESDTEVIVHVVMRRRWAATQTTTECSELRLPAFWSSCHQYQKAIRIFRAHRGARGRSLGR